MLNERCYVCGKQAVGWTNPYGSTTASLGSEQLRPACSVHGNFARPPMEHDFISTKRGLKVKCGKYTVTTLHWGDVAALQATPRASIHAERIPIYGLEETAPKAGNGD